MLIRFVALGAVLLTTAGCSNSAVFGAPSGLTNAHIEPVSTTAAAAPIDIQRELMTKKTRGGKMLAAIALERVTGRKPHPARLSELD